MNLSYAVVTLHIWACAYTYCYCQESQCKKKHTTVVQACHHSELTDMDIYVYVNRTVLQQCMCTAYGYSNGFLNIIPEYENSKCGFILVNSANYNKKIDCIEKPRINITKNQKINLTFVNSNSNRQGSEVCVRLVYQDFLDKITVKCGGKRQILPFDGNLSVVTTVNTITYTFTANKTDKGNDNFLIATGFVIGGTLVVGCIITFVLARMKYRMKNNVLPSLHTDCQNVTSSSVVSSVTNTTYGQQGDIGYEVVEFNETKQESTQCHASEISNEPESTYFLATKFHDSSVENSVYSNCHQIQENPYSEVNEDD